VGTLKNTVYVCHNVAPTLPRQPLIHAVFHLLLPYPSLITMPRSFLHQVVPLFVCYVMTTCAKFYFRLGLSQFIWIQEDFATGSLLVLHDAKCSLYLLVLFWVTVQHHAGILTLCEGGKPMGW
jgi:hypothetical protein